MKICKIVIDVPLTNQPDLFVRGGVFDPALSDRMLIYGIVKEKARKDSRKIIHFRSYKNFDPVKYDNLLMTAPWHVGNLFDDVELYYWDRNHARHRGRILPSEKEASKG